MREIGGSPLHHPFPFLALLPPGLPQIFALVGYVGEETWAWSGRKETDICSVTNTRTRHFAQYFHARCSWKFALLQDFSFLVKTLLWPERPREK